MGRLSLSPGRFRRLRWQLTLNYTVATVATLLTVELLLLGALAVLLVALLSGGYLQAQLIDTATAAWAPALRYFLAQTPPDQDGVAVWLDGVEAASSITLPLSFDATDELLVIGSDGVLLGIKPFDLLGSDLVGLPLDADTVPGLAGPLQAALAGTEDVKRLYTLPRADEKVVLAMPIWDATHEHVLGALVALAEAPTLSSSLADVLPIIAASLLVSVLMSGLAGAAFGYLAARGPVRRLGRLSDATLAWSHGDFAVHVDDTSGDELGDLARRLNEMARQLSHLVETRRALAVLDERNRLARDLHDSVKQQAFAAAAQISGVRTLLERDPAAAAVHVEEAERLIDDLRYELTNLILELRPAALEGEGLASAVHTYAAEWSEQNGIAAEVRISRERHLPLEIEGPLFRILQEALANVARHSEAGQVEIVLVYADDNVVLTITDDGRGFQASEASRGFGLKSMRQRVQLLVGELKVESSPGQGTSITCSVPVNDSDMRVKVKAHD